eukprot:6177495-Pleurochrysis_carterae.AAC.1
MRTAPASLRNASIVNAWQASLPCRTAATDAPAAFPSPSSSSKPEHTCRLTHVSQVLRYSVDSCDLIESVRRIVFRHAYARALADPNAKLRKHSQQSVQIARSNVRSTRDGYFMCREGPQRRTCPAGRGAWSFPSPSLPGKPSRSACRECTIDPLAPCQRREDRMPRLPCLPRLTVDRTRTLTAAARLPFTHFAAYTAHETGGFAPSALRL